MTWEDFNTEVRLYLTVHNRRQGIQTLIDTLIKSAAIDLQTSIESLQQYHSETLDSGDLDEDGFASYGDLPAGQIYSARLVSFDSDTDEEDDTKYLYLNQVSAKNWLDWKLGFSPNGVGQIFINPVRRQFAFVPPLEDDAKLIIEWEGVKMEFEDNDVTPFDARCALAVSNYVLAFLARSVDNDPASAAAYERNYARTKRTIYSDALTRQRIKVETRPTDFHPCSTSTTTSPSVEGDMEDFAGGSLETFAGVALETF